jgi:predicted permease
MRYLAAFLENLWEDVSRGVRGLGRSPGLLAVSAASLGLGIGVNALLYMGVSTIYYHRPTMTQSDRVVGVEPGNANQFSYPNYLDLQRIGSFDGVVGFRTSSLNLGAGDRVTPVGVLNVTANFFDVLGIRAMHGRTFSAAEAAAERGPRLVVVTFDFWRNRLQSDPGAVGATLTLNGEPFVIAGVLPDSFKAVTGWIAPQLYVPVSRLTLPTLNARGSPSLTILARLARGVTSAEAQGVVTELGRSLERTYPVENERMSQPATVFAAADMQFRGTPVGFRAAATMALIAAALVLTIACINVMGLLLVRAAHRRHEVAIRIALGAGRWRMVQAMLVEAFLVVIVGAAVGLPTAFLLNRIPFVNQMALMQDAMALDGRLIPFALIVIAGATIVCGLVPALRATRHDGTAGVRSSAETVTPRLGLRQGLVVVQLAISLVLVVATLLCVRSQGHINQVDVGFDLERGVVARFGLDSIRYPDDERPRLAERIVERLGQIPGVSPVAAATLVPLGGDSLIRSFHPAGRTDILGTRPSAFSVGPRYFQALGIPLLQGRDFDRSHVAGAPVAAIVNETFARTYFRGTEVLGQRIQTADEPEATIIGVVRDHRIDTIGEAAKSVVFYPYAQRPGRLIVHAKTEVDPEGLVSAIARAIDEVDPRAPVSIDTRRRSASLELTMRGVATVMVGGIGLVGLLLAMVGLYGVMSYVADSRTAEVGVRMALGASARRIRQEMLQRGGAVVAVGMVAGAVASAVVMPALRTFLAGVSPFDPAAFALAAAILAVAGLGASYLPAFRASRIDPIRALRQS